MRGSDFSGILNIISFHQYNPVTDKRIYQNYDRDNLWGKKKKQEMLAEGSGSTQSECSLLGLILKQVEKQGQDLIGYCMEELMQEEIQCIILGSGLPKYEEIQEKISRHYR